MSEKAEFRGRGFNIVLCPKCGKQSCNMLDFSPQIQGKAKFKWWIFEIDKTVTLSAGVKINYDPSCGFAQMEFHDIVFKAE